MATINRKSLLFLVALLSSFLLGNSALAQSTIADISKGCAEKIHDNPELLQGVQITGPEDLKKKVEKAFIAIKSAVKQERTRRLPSVTIHQGKADGRSARLAAKSGIGGGCVSGLNTNNGQVDLYPNCRGKDPFGIAVHELCHTVMQGTTVSCAVSGYGGTNSTEAAAEACAAWIIAPEKIPSNCKAQIQQVMNEGGGSGYCRGNGGGDRKVSSN